MIIDTHFHAFPGKYLELIPESQNDVRGVGFHAFDHRQYIDVMDKYGVDVGVLSNTGGRIEKDGNRARALELCKILNDSFAEAHAKHPSRFKAFARLPMIDMDDCVRELQRCFTDLKMHGVILSTISPVSISTSLSSSRSGTLSPHPASRSFFIPPTLHARPTGTNIHCIKKFSGRQTALWQFPESFTMESSTATRISGSSRPTSAG